MTPEIWSALVSIFMPYLIQALRSFVPDKRWLHYTISLLVSVAVGSITTVLTGKFDTANLLNSIGVSIIASQAVYNYWFLPQKQDKVVDRIVEGTK